MISCEGSGQTLLVECGNVGCWEAQVWGCHQHSANLRPWLIVVEL